MHPKLGNIKKLKWELVIFVLFVLIRLPDLGHDMFNTDVWKWKSRSYDFSTGVFTLDFDKTIQKYHPGVSLMWVGTAGIKLYNFYHKVILGAPAADNVISNVFALHAIQKSLLVVLMALLLALCYYPLKCLLGERHARLVLILISVEPFYVALTRVMHLEGLMTTFMLSSFCWFLFSLEKGTKKSLALSAFLAAGAVLTKTTALFLIPLYILILVFAAWPKRKDLRKVFLSHLRLFLSWLGLFFLFFVLMWPAMLTNPLEALSSLYKGIFDVGVETEHYQIFLGRWVKDPGPIFYWLVLLFRLSWWSILGFFGFAIAHNRLKLTDAQRKFVTYTLFLVIFYLIEMTIPAKKLDRYILPSLVGITMIAGVFFEQAYLYLGNKFRYGRQLFVLVLATVSLATLVNLHPYYLSYYSPLMGGLKKGIYTLEPKWMIGQAGIIEFFAQKLQAGEIGRYEAGESLDSQLNKAEIREKLTVGFQEKYYTQIWPFLEEIGGRATIKDIDGHALNSNYFVYPVYDDDSYLETRVRLKKIGTVKLRGVDLYNIYQTIY